MLDEVCVLAATGMLGTGFAETSLEFGMQRQPHVIGCDAGSTDPGPFYLGSGVRDPVVLRQHDDFLAGLRSTIAAQAEASLGLTIDRDFRLVFRVYGQNGSMGALEPDKRIDGHEIGLVTIPRPVCSGDLEDSDVFGGQQHAPLVDLEIP